MVIVGLSVVTVIVVIEDRTLVAVIVVIVELTLVTVKVVIGGAYSSYCESGDNGSLLLLL